MGVCFDCCAVAGSGYTTTAEKITAVNSRLKHQQKRQQRGVKIIKKNSTVAAATNTTESTHTVMLGTTSSETMGLPS